MPQMSPILWTYLFLTFILTMIIILNKIFYLTIPNTMNFNIINKEINKELKWMW